MSAPSGDLNSALRAIAGAAVTYARAVAAALPAAARRDALLIGIILAYWLVGLIVAPVVGMSPADTITTYLGTYVPMTALMIVSLILARGVMIMVHKRPAHPLRQLLHEIPSTLATSERVASALPMMAGMLLFGGTFTVIKASMPHFAPFSWDAAFEQWDRWLHGGVAPWQLLQPLLGRPSITHALDRLYDLWFYFLSLIWAWQAFTLRDLRLRRQFFMTLLTSWILLGNVAAMLLSSAGPCFFGRLIGQPGPYAPLMNYLLEADLVQPMFASEAQRILWRAYTENILTIGAGISAMPSMHVALAVLFALVCWRTWRWLGIVMAIYALIVLVGSVHLAWHYAVDGYLGAAAMIVIWWVVGRIVARRDEEARDPAPSDIGATEAIARDAARD